MASPQASQRFLSRNSITRVDHDPGSTDAKLASPDGGTTLSYKDMQSYNRFVVLATNQALTGAGITKVEIVASATTAFSSVTVIKDSGTVAADALADWVALECSAEEVAQEGADGGVNLRYVTARLTCANAADESVVFLIGSEPRFSSLDLTPASTIA
jgi:hypothetical protein